MAILSTLVVSGVSRAADGVADMTWNNCTGPVAKDISVATTGYEIFLSVLGIDQLHKAYDVRVIYGDASQTVPDCWRFDVAGCQGSGAILQEVSAKACPAAFDQATPGGLLLKKVILSPITDPYAPTLMQVLLANSYAAGVSAVNPATRYLLEGIKFDHSFSVTGAGNPPADCGGFEKAMCFKLSYATYLNLNGDEVPFGRARDPLSVTSYNTAVEDICANVPAKATTWGHIKSQYH
jgi:hypothetical protein